jgi:hypothetical protein
MHTCKKKKIIGILSFFLSYFACTNPFATRNAETPEIQDNLTIPIRPLAYDEVLYFFQNALNERNLVNHMNCFIDDTFPIPASSYHYFYDKRISQESFIDWSLQDEHNYLNNIINDPDNSIPELKLDFLDKNFTYTPLANNWNDSIQVAPFRYELRISYRDTTQVYRGISLMKLIANKNAQWAIYYWEDRQDDTENTLSWSFLKAARRNR